MQTCPDYADAVLLVSLRVSLSFQWIPFRYLQSFICCAPPYDSQVPHQAANTESMMIYK